MNEVQAYDAVREVLKPQRFEHTVRVTEEAMKLADIYGGNVETIRIASILHDYAKYRSIKEMRERVIKDSYLPNKLLYYGDELLHAFVGATFVQQELHVNDDAVLSAIRYHTTGKAGMTIEEKIVFLADYIEPGRHFPEVNYVRKVAQENLDQACLYALKNTIRYLSGRNLAIYPDTFQAYNDLIMNTKPIGGPN